MADTGKVNIHGKTYSTVALRVKEFREEHKLDLSIETLLVERDDTTVVMKASITDGERVLATGYAEERRDASLINKTSALENCETSAIGRALAAFGMAGTEYASADEVANAISNQGSDQKPVAQKATTKQIEMLFNLAKQQGYNEKADAHKWLTDEGKKDPLLMSSAEASKLIGRLMET